MIFTQEAPLTEVFFREGLHPDQNGIWKCWFLIRGENQSSRRKTTQRTNNKLSPRMTPTLQIEPATLMEGEWSHHCADRAPRVIYLSV